MIEHRWKLKVLHYVSLPFFGDFELGRPICENCGAGWKQRRKPCPVPRGETSTSPSNSNSAWASNLCVSNPETGAG
jgi:hypothetical protein